MTLVSVQNLTISFGFPPLLDGISVNIEEGDRLCLLGRNGTGKSTLLKAMAGLTEPDGGVVTGSKGVRAVYLPQEFPAGLSGTAIHAASEGNSERVLAAEQTLSLLGISPEADTASLSGGEKRRVMLAGVLASGADLLLLDEPTNHLDIDAILRLEEYILRKVKSIVFVTHDRAFARRIANRVAEIDRGSLYSFDTSYDRFIERREELLEAEIKARANFDKKLAEEEEWLRRGVKARRTRNEGRVQALLKMREDFRLRRERSGAAKMEIHQAARTGNLVIETKNISFAYPEPDSDGELQTADKPLNTPESNPLLVKDFSTMIMRGDRVGVVGPNGSGKTTLLKLLLGGLDPSSGTVRHGVNLQPLYLDQMRSSLDPDKTVIENVGEGSDIIMMNGRKKHVISYLKDFLFTADRAKSPVAHLSGGERNRLLLARLFARPSNLLVMDEPTNDLDVETLELLEELLQEYPGTILLVSHDRAFLDNVVTDCFVLAGNGKVIEYAGGYSDWFGSELRRRTEEAGAGPSKGGGRASGKAGADPAKGGGRASGSAGGHTPGTAGIRTSGRPRKLTFREAGELEELPDRIAEIEGEIERLHGELADPELYRSGRGDPAALTRLLQGAEERLQTAYARWEELDGVGKDRE